MLARNLGKNLNSGAADAPPRPPAPAEPEARRPE